MSASDEIKQRIDIVDLVAQYVTLRRAGRAYTGLCPFHQERTPSFHVDPARQTWHCFGACGTGGDIFGFVMKKEGCDFREALRILAERAGVELHKHRDEREDSRRARLYELNEAAAAFFAAALAGDGGGVARAYLDERGVGVRGLEMFQLGYAPNSWEALTRHLEGRGFEHAEVVDARLAVEGERGAYDRFRHRLMYPIRDDRGRIAGFGGRLLPGEALGAGDVQPKYVNTSQSPVFDKGAILYGLHLAKDAVRAAGAAIIVEGYMDAIAAHEHGYGNVVASMGTALTERQVALLKRHTNTIVLALDADNAGSEATIRSAYEIVNASVRKRPVTGARGIVRQVETLDLDLRVLSLPEGRDPDDVIRNEPERWPEMVASARPVVEHLLEVARQRHDLTDPRQRSAAVRELTPFIALTADRVLQAHYLQQLARMAQVDEATLRAELKVPARGHDASPDLTRSPSVRGVRDKREAFLLALLFRYPELRDEAAAIEPEIFGDAEHRALFEAWLDVGADAARMPAELRPRFEQLARMAVPVYRDSDLVRALHSTVARIEDERLRAQKQATGAMVETIDDGAAVAERARAALAGAALVDGDVDAAAALVEDMEAGLRVHRRLIERSAPPARRSDA